MSSPPPGWYYADGDPPGTERYWNGTTWQGGPQPAQPKYIPSPQTAAQMPQAYSYGSISHENSQATAALVCGIIGFFCCGLLGPVAWYLANQEIKGIDAGRRDPSNRGTATAGKVIGIIVTALMVLAIIAWIFLVVAAGSTSVGPR